MSTNHQVNDDIAEYGRSNSATLEESDSDNISINTPSDSIGNVSIRSLNPNSDSAPSSAPPSPPTPKVDNKKPVSIENASTLTTLPLSEKPLERKGSTPVKAELFTQMEKKEQELEGEGYSNVVGASLAAVSAIVDNIFEQKKTGDDVSKLASREIDKYYEHGNTEGAALLSNSQQQDGIHGEGISEVGDVKAPYQDEKYGEQPPMALEDAGRANKNAPIVSSDQVITTRRGREKAVKAKEEPPPNPFKDILEKPKPQTMVQQKPTPNTTATAYSFTDVPKPGSPRSPYHDNVDQYDNVAMELGMTPESHPQFFRKKKYKVPFRIFYNKYCQYGMIISGFILLTLSVAALVTRGFNEVKKLEDQKHQETQVSSSNGKKEKLDWWHVEAGNSIMTLEQFQQLTYAMEESYLPIWFDRKSGWEGQTYEEAVEFCRKHDDFMPCPYDVYCPAKTGKLIEGHVDDNISWAPFRDETDGWVQVGAGGDECDVFLGGSQNAQYRNFDPDLTKHIMCCLQNPLNFNPSNNVEDSTGAETFRPNLDIPEPPSDVENSPFYVNEWYNQKIVEQYDPRWYDRESKWHGHTYDDAISFCYSDNKRVPCPYSVYCPNGPSGKLIFDVHFDEGEAWAATGDRFNQYVKVGHDDTCNRVTSSNPAGYGRNNQGVDVLSHLMCCYDAIQGVSEDLGIGETWEATAEQSSSNSQHSGQSTLTELEYAVQSKYIPFWFGFKEGWSGGTYENARDFCASVDPGRGDSFHLCPLMAYCPNGPYHEKPLFLQKEAFNEEQWAPTSFAPNDWIQIGKLSEDNPQTCMLYRETQKMEPSWGLDGSEPGLKQHILCCKGGDTSDFDYEGVDEIDNAQFSVAETAAAALSDTNIQASVSNELAQGSIQGFPTHNGAGNSAPHGGATNHEAALVIHLNPIWFDHDLGWNGGSHDDAELFCSTKGDDAPMTLCPYDAYCPNGPTYPSLGGPSSSFATQEQYAPYHGDEEHWVLIGRFNNAKTTTCLDYNQLFGDTPSWAYDDSRKELKQHILCCASSETLQSSSEVGLQSISTNSKSPTAKPTYAPEEEGDTQLLSIDPTPGIWFGVSDGWTGGSRIDAIKFCYNTGEDADGIPMMLCPYEAYCPDGPSNPVAPNSYIGINESAEQWAPSLSKPNHWILVGSRGGNDSTTCLDTWQLEGDDDPSWGKDGSNAEHKHHVKCCSIN